MRDVLGPGTILGYCTNVHAGATLDQTKANLEKYALQVKRRVSPNQSMGVGLWLSAPVARQLLDEDRMLEMGACVEDHGLSIYTLNGFPFDAFHLPTVKHAVYEPNWSSDDRYDYTSDLFVILGGLLGPWDDLEGSISTLPIGWPSQLHDIDGLRHAAVLLHEMALKLERDGTSGPLLHLDLEPEPGCVLQNQRDAAAFLQSLARQTSPEIVRRRLRICHDICHAAAMFEDQADVLAHYREASIKVGKVQISNAIRVPFDEYSEPERREAFAQLSAFAEDRYLHQTMIRMPDGEMRFFEDLPLALAAVAANQTARGEWRVHFHVPVFLERFGLIQTTRHEIADFLAAIRPEDEIHHFEVETYAWDVLPSELRVDDLAEGIAREMQWVIDNFGQPGRPASADGKAAP